MTSYAGRGLLLKISDGGTPAVFLTLGAARATVFDISNDVAEATHVGSTGEASYTALAGSRNARVTLQGIFKDSTAEERLRQAAHSGALCRYLMVFPNGNSYEADFIVESYRREGSHDGLELFSASLIRSGEGIWTSL